MTNLVYSYDKDPDYINTPAYSNIPPPKLPRKRSRPQSQITLSYSLETTVNWIQNNQSLQNTLHNTLSPTLSAPDTNDILFDKDLHLELTTLIQKTASLSHIKDLLNPYKSVTQTNRFIYPNAINYAYLDSLVDIFYGLQEMDFLCIDTPDALEYLFFKSAKLYYMISGRFLFLKDRYFFEKSRYYDEIKKNVHFFGTPYNYFSNHQSNSHGLCIR
jgi:hypothetical protein